MFLIASSVVSWIRCCTYNDTLHNEIHIHEQRCDECNVINSNLNSSSQSASREDLFLQSMNKRYSQAKNRFNIISNKHSKNLKKFQKL